MATFKKGDRVLCINTNWMGNWPIKSPNYLDVYTIDRVLKDSAVTLIEIDLGPVEKALLEQGDLPEPGYWPWHFLKIEVGSMCFELAEAIKEEGL